MSLRPSALALVIAVCGVWTAGAQDAAPDAALPEVPVAEVRAEEMLVVPKAEDRKVEGVPEPDLQKGDAEPQETPPPETAEAAGEGGEIVPEPFPISRYAVLWERSPFQLESIAPPTESAGLSQRYALTGIAQIDGEPIAFLMERASQQRIMIDKKTNNAGLTLVQVDLQPKQSDSSVTLRSGGEVGVVKFDENAAMNPAMVPQPSAMGVPQPGIRPIVQNGAVPQPFVPGQQPGQFPQQAQLVQNGVNPAIPGQMPGIPGAAGVVPAVPGPPIPNQGGQVQQVAPDQQQMPPPRVIRRRAIIPSSP